MQNAKCKLNLAVALGMKRRELDPFAARQPPFAVCILHVALLN
jgi:hypothetical protein